MNFANLYRPTTLDEVIGQKSIITILKNQLLNNCFNNYLFAGPSGDGKTTTARAFGNALKAEIIEVDAASNNGVDNIRAINDLVYERSLHGEYKVIILDEAHMLTLQSWNALLKTLEETPKYTIFILCTTDPQKIPQTILNRVQRFNFTKIDASSIYERLKYICTQESIPYEEDALSYISKVSDGSMREAISLLEQASMLAPSLTLNGVFELLGGVSYKSYFELANNLLDGEEAKTILSIENISNSGGDLKLFIDQYINFNLDILKYILFKNIEITKIPNRFLPDLNNLTNIEKPDSYYNYVVNKLLNLKGLLKYDSNIKSTIEIIMIQIARCQ